ncbi:hypothetical protein OPV22_034520 [Ensete ventricosum]|uniref:Uncharacterized protein n=1 Tax=Ensete ventricosum TaxID=4639 RepID=A0AAV8Q521_ENSVE|nr:hypothetical protein OPV22_034520 [Ensete ventricosum]
MSFLTGFSRLCYTDRVDTTRNNRGGRKYRNSVGGAMSHSKVDFISSNTFISLPLTLTSPLPLPLRRLAQRGDVSRTEDSFSFVPSSPPKPQPASLVHPFESALVARLASLFPLPESSGSVALFWLAQAVRLLAVTFSDAVLFLTSASWLSTSLPPPTAAGTPRNCGGRGTPWPSGWASPAAISSPSPATSSAPSPRPFPPRGKLSSVRRATYAVEAVSGLIAGAVVAVLGCGRLAVDRVPADFTWADEYHKVAAAVSHKLPGDVSIAEMEAVKAAVRKLTDRDHGRDRAERRQG